MSHFISVSVTRQVRVHLVPRVASTSLRDSLLPAEVQRVEPDVPGPEPRFMVVRYPLHRLMSTWRLICFDWPMHHLGKPYSDRLYAKGYRLKQPLDEFIGVLLERHEEDLHTRLQVSYAGPFPVQVIRFEDLATRWEDVRRRDPLIAPLRRLNVTRPHHVRLEAAQARRVERLLAPDLELYESTIYTRSATR